MFVLATLAACESTSPPVPPTAPGPPAAVPASDREITLTWAIPNGEVTSVELERAQGGGPFAAIVTLPGTAASHDDTGLTPATGYRYRLRACNEAGCSDFGPEASATTFATLALSTTSLPPVIVGGFYETALGATGGNGQLAFSLEGGEIPSGMTLTPAGVLVGTPTASGTFHFIVRVASADGQTASRELALRVRDVLMVTTVFFPDWVVGQSHDEALNAVGGDSVYTWSVEAGSLPAGLSLSDRGVISGIPVTEQTARFTARVRSGDGQTAIQELTISVIATAPPARVLVATAALPPGIAGLTYNPQLRAFVTNSSPPSWSLVSGTLPPGISLGGGGGLSGRPTETGSFTFTVRATAGGGTADRTYTVRIDPNDVSRFNITRFDVVRVSAAISPHVAEAIARWESVIVGEMESDSIPRAFFENTGCGGFGDEANGAAIEDVIVMVHIAPIDGEGGVLGQASPCAYREDNNLTGIGLLTLDSRDLTSYAGTPTLTDLIFHEIGHVLGVGTLWDGIDCTPGTPQCTSYLEGQSGYNPTFTGPLAVAEWQALGGAGKVPVENTGGSGAELSHWREATFESEIMTGFLERPGTLHPLSRVTIASMADLGYSVSYAAADAYSLPEAPELRAPALIAGPWEIPLPDPPVPLRRR